MANGVGGVSDWESDSQEELFRKAFVRLAAATTAATEELGATRALAVTPALSDTASSNTEP